MESKAYMRAKLVNYTNADCSDVEAKNCRYHYSLKFEEDIGFDWLKSQIAKVSGGCEASVEPYKIRPSGMHAFEIEVRELQRREGIDDDQHGLDSFK